MNKRSLKKMAIEDEVRFYQIQGHSRIGLGIHKIMNASEVTEIQIINRTDNFLNDLLLLR